MPIGVRPGPRNRHVFPRLHQGLQFPRERGDNPDSIAFAKKIDTYITNQSSTLTFIIGGADGLPIAAVIAIETGGFAVIDFDAQFDR